MQSKSLWLAMALLAGLALTPTLVDARAGSGSSSGSRGARTYQAPPLMLKPARNSLTPPARVRRRRRGGRSAKPHRPSACITPITIPATRLLRPA